MLNQLGMRLTAAAALTAASVAYSPAFAAAATATTQLLGVHDDAGLLSFSNNFYYLDAATPNLVGLALGATPSDQNLVDGHTYNQSLASARVDGFGPYTSAGALKVGEGHASAQWSFDWEASASGTASVLVDYLSSVVIANLRQGDEALAKSYLQVSLDGTSTYNELLSVLLNQEGEASTIDALPLSFAVTAGQTGSLTITLQSDAKTVPVPATLWLFAAAWPGLLAWRRRAPITA